jgi:hypothetical protein
MSAHPSSSSSTSLTLSSLRVTEFNCIILCACSKEVITDTKVLVGA